MADINTSLTSGVTTEGTDFHYVQNATLKSFEIDLGTGFSATETVSGGGRLFFIHIRLSI